MSNQEILIRAVAALNRSLLREQADIVDSGEKPCLTLMGKRFLCVIKPHLTLGDLKENINEVYKETPILFLTTNASPKMLEHAKTHNINILDCAGNYHIQYHHKNGSVFFMLANKGEKPIEDTDPKAYPIFLEKGLKVIFYLLLDKKNIGLPYRQIVDATGVSVGTVKNIIGGLVYHQFARVEGNKRFLINTERLLKLWSANYGQILKPKLFRGRFSFRDEKTRNNWEAIALPAGILWGGEPAAALTEGFLTPGEFTIYADPPTASIVRTGAVIPDSKGDIEVYEKFWGSSDNEMVAPSLLIYADLIETANGRCLEAAQKIKGNELKYLF